MAPPVISPVNVDFPFTAKAPLPVMSPVNVDVPVTAKAPPAVIPLLTFKLYLLVLSSPPILMLLLKVTDGLLPEVTDIRFAKVFKLSAFVFVSPSHSTVSHITVVFFVRTNTTATIPNIIANIIPIVYDNIFINKLII